MAGIYHNAELGVISMSSDGTNWLTIADKNLGATQVYNDGDTLSEANSGKYYQWGNNHGFPFTGSVTTSSTQVDASQYGPTLYYDSDTFITTNTDPYDWSSSRNNNLRGDTTNTNIARKGPCNEGYHIPSVTERNSVLSIMTGFGFTSGSYYKTYLFAPPVGTRLYSNGNVNGQGSTSYYWASSMYSSNEWGGAINMDGIVEITGLRRATGVSIRPFANTPVVPDYTWERLYGDEIPAPKKIIKRFQNNGNYYYFGEPPVHATGVTLNKSSLTFTEAGQTEQLVATVTPSDAVEKSVTWTSSDTTVAMVARDGTVTCITPGECTITCTVNDGGYTATCGVRQEQLIELMLVAGGGGGGATRGSGFGAGGGGGGGLVLCEFDALDITGEHCIIIGAGGGGGGSSSDATNGCNGGDSCFGDIIAYGGGGGGRFSCTSGTGGGGSGGSGGGGGSNGANGGSSCGQQGNNGGNGGSNNRGGGGGGGYLCAGCNGDSMGGAGGAGYSTDFSGETHTYSSGGGGGNSGAGGNGGGNGGGSQSGGGNASYYGGGGGGAGQTTSTLRWGGSGYQGIALIRYRTDLGLNITGGTCYTCGDYTIHCFTSNGTLTVN